MNKSKKQIIDAINSISELNFLWASPEPAENTVNLTI